MFRKTTLFTVVLALLIVVFGSYIRSSGAELGCPDWPGCYGQAIVGNDVEFKNQAAIDFPGHYLDVSKAQKVMAHRYLLALLGLLIVVIAVSAWTQKKCRVAAINSSISLVVLFGLQVALAIWAIELKAMPVIVTAQLLVGLFIFWQLYWLYLRVNPALELAQTAGMSTPRLFARFAMLVLFLQIVLGGWTSINDAGLACADFPKCNGAWLPVANYLNALNLFSGLDTGYTGVLSFDGQVAVHWMHRVGAIVSFIVLTLVMLNATSEQNPRAVRKAGLLLSMLLMIQIVLGVFTVKFELPVFLSVAHAAFAALLMLPLIAVSFYSKYTFAEGVEVGAVPPAETLEVIEAAVDQAVIAEEAGYVEPSAESLYLRLKTQLSKTRTGLGGVLLGQKAINQDLLEEIESSLLLADIGIDATTEIIAKLTEGLERHQLNDGQALEALLKQQMLEMLQPSCQPLKIPEQEGPFVILVVGINGVGKTTTIGKLAKRLQLQGHSVMLAAGDTFRAAAVEQLETWGERNNIHVVAQHTGADSASVIFDGVQSAKAKGIDVLIADTAGRLHTKSNLMDELSKIKRIMAKVDENAPHEVLLVLDAGTGQNALSQTKIFNESVQLSGLALTKLDGTAKGGVIFALAKQFKLPIRFIGVGEGIDDLQDFDAKVFVDALFVKD